MRNTPPGFSHVHYALIGGNVPQYCVSHDVHGHRMLIDASPERLVLGTKACAFAALVEFHAPPRVAPTGMHDPRNWEVGFVQTMTAGSIVYEYRSPRGLVVKAAIGPEHVPCLDGDGFGVFYDSGPLGRQRFGTRDDGAQALGRPAEVSPFLVSTDVKFVCMDDAPGTGAQLELPCRQAGDRRALLNKVYHLGWTDPLDPSVDANTARLARAEGRLAFKTWLAMRHLPSMQLFYLHEFEWVAWFGATAVPPGMSAAPAGRTGAALIRETAVGAHLAEPVVTGPVANASVCVKFLPP